MERDCKVSTRFPLLQYPMKSFLKLFFQYRFQRTFAILTNCKGKGINDFLKNQYPTKKNFHFRHSAIIYTANATILQSFFIFLHSWRIATHPHTHIHTHIHIREAPRLKNAIFAPKQADLSHFRHEADKSHHRAINSSKQNVLNTERHDRARPGATRSKRNNNITNARTRYSNVHR